MANQELMNIHKTSNGPQANSTGPILHICSRRHRNYTYEFNVEARSLIEREHRPELSRCAMTKYKDTIYAVGGKRNGRVCDIGLKYDIARKTWSEFICKVGKSFCGICTSNDKMFLIGGSMMIDRYDMPQATCSLYNYEIDRWTDLPDMKESRGNPAVSFYDSSLYVFGGFSDMVNRKVERYDPRENKWYSAGTGEIHGVCTSIVYSNSIYYINTYTGKFCRYEPRTLNFTPIDTSPKTARWIDSANDQLYLLHYDGIDVYDACSNSWNTIFSHQFEQCPILIA